MFLGVNKLPKKRLFILEKRVFILQLLKGLNVVFCSLIFQGVLKILFTYSLIFQGVLN